MAKHRGPHAASLGGTLLGLACIIALWACTVWVYREVSVREWHALWNLEPRALHAYTRPADPQYAQAFRKIQSRALEHGWFVPDLTLHQTNGLFDIWYLRWEATHIAMVNAKQQDIVIDGRRSSGMSDEDLECLMGHETAHVIDYRYGRERDMNLWPYRCQTNEAFADTVGAMLCGRVQYWRFFRTHIRFRPPGQSPCEPASTPVNR